MLISDILRDQLKADVSVLMGANVANDMATDQFCETTIGCALTGREESHGSSRGSGAERSWQKEAEDGMGGRGTGWLRVGRGSASKKEQCGFEILRAEQLAWGGTGAKTLELGNWFIGRENVKRT